MGTYIVLNLFLGILIDNFRQDDDDDVDAEAGIVAQARDEIKKVRVVSVCEARAGGGGVAFGRACVRVAAQCLAHTVPCPYYPAAPGPCGVV